MLLIAVAVVVAFAVGSVFLIAYFSSARAERPEESRLRAFRNGLRRHPGSFGLVDVSLAELFRAAEPDEDPVTPFAAFDQVRQRAVDQAARAAGLAAALVAREPSVAEPATELDQVSEDPFPGLSFSEFGELARAELMLAELTLAKMALAEPDLAEPEPAEPELAEPEVPALTSAQDAAQPDAGPDPQDAAPAKRERVRTV